MATNWNDMQAALNTRSSELSGAEETAPSDFTDLGTTSNIDVGGVTSDPQWSVEGTAPQRVDIFEPVVDEPIERWIARPRPAGFEKSYINLDPALDADLISSEGLTYSAPIATWIGYYPGMTSNTQIGKVTEFIVGGANGTSGSSSQAAPPTILHSLRATRTTIGRSPVMSLNP